MPKIFKNKYNKEKILQIINSEDIKFLDLSDFLILKTTNLFFPHGQFGHFNSKGYSLIADEIINNFKNKLISLFKLSNIFFPKYLSPNSLQ